MSLNGAAMFIAMVIIIILFEIILTITKGSAGMSFITPTNLFSILRQQAYTGIIAFGLTLVMITGNIDLSVGSMLTFLCCVCAKIMMGSDNGLSGHLRHHRSRRHLRPHQRCAGELCKAQFVYYHPGHQLHLYGAGAADLLRHGAGHPRQLRPAVSGGGRYLLRAGTYSHRLVCDRCRGSGLCCSAAPYTVSSSIPSAPTRWSARFSGIRAKRNTTVSYVITGVCVGLAAVLMMANVKSSNPQAANGKEMEIILAVVLGGVSVTGGKGSVWGSIIGVLFYGVLSAGFTQLNLSTYVQWVIMGVIMVTALSLDVLKERGIKLWKKK